jgi:hypothetical protein
MWIIILITTYLCVLGIFVFLQRTVTFYVCVLKCKLLMLYLVHQFTDTFLVLQRWQAEPTYLNPTAHF